jgi:GNAT superfamily N-acetyltransferase
MTHIPHIRRGTAGDLDTIIGMIDEATDWLRGKGTDQWAQPWPDRAARDGRVRRGLRNGNTWIAEVGGQAIGTITYRPHGNHMLWAPKERREDAVYVSRLIVGRNVAGDGIGAALIDWAAAQAVRDWKAQWIRIDVWTTNVALHNYYEKRGFRYLRIASCEAKRYPSAALFQKPTSEIDLDAARRFTLVPAGERQLVGAGCS